MTKKQEAAVEFFSKPRTLVECQAIIRQWESTRKYFFTGSTNTDTLEDAEEMICDIFMDEMCELDLHFK